MDVEKNTLITKTNKQLAYTHIKQGSDRICFMFSGAGYTYTTSRCCIMQRW